MAINYRMVTTSVSNAAAADFDKLYEKLCKYAQKNRLKPPKKSDLYSRMIQAYKVEPQEYFNHS